MLTYPWKCIVLHCNHLGNTWKPLVLMTRHFDYCPNASEGDNQSVRSLAPVVSRCFPGGYNVKLYISRGRLAWWLLAFLHSEWCCKSNIDIKMWITSQAPHMGLLETRWTPCHQISVSHSNWINSKQQKNRHWCYKMHIDSNIWKYHQNRCTPLNGII